jgi:hypothetical protein
MQTKTIGLIIILFLSASCNWASEFPVVVNNTTRYIIAIPVKSTPNEYKAAQILQQYILKSTGVTLFIAKENETGGRPAFYIGKTIKSKSVVNKPLANEGYVTTIEDENITIAGGTGKGVIYGVYDFIEQFLEGKKYSDEPGQVAENKDWSLPGNFKQEYVPTFQYRQVYYPMSNDPEYLDWHKLHKFEDLWGIWGHSYFKLVNPQTYFKTNPEYFAYENGQRKPTQLCMSNDEVVKIAIETLKVKMIDLPYAEYWSISAEDEIGYCLCEKCRTIHEEEGTPSGAHLRFVNKIAQAFPDKKFTTLAYTYTMRAPSKTKPAPNVYVMLSTIDAYRTQPIEKEPSAATFRRALEGWEKITHNLFVWDYTTQFTNYLAPFPELFNLASNIRYFKAHHVQGIFSQGSGDTYGEMAELKSYLIAKLMSNSELNEVELMEDFCKGYYKSAGRYVMDYINLLQTESRKTNRQIDIYGNPVNEYNSYLTPELLDQFSTLFDNAEAVVEDNEKIINRIYRLRLSLDYVSLQQARFFGPDKHGYLVQDEETLNYLVKGNMPKRVTKFTESLERYKVTELSEGGLNPEQYKAEWQQLFDRGWKPNYAMDAKVTVKYPFVQDYPAKRERTLVDGMIGLNDYSYNWLCFYGNDIDVTIDMETTKEVSHISMNFLDDPRHWIFLPHEIEITVSADGYKYHTAIAEPTNYNLATALDEHYDAKPVNFNFKLFPQRVRYVHVKVKNQSIIPNWRYRPNKKPMLAIDEIYLN